jgi:hypothetical protein
VFFIGTRTAQAGLIESMITFNVPVIGKAWSDVSTLVVGTMRHNEDPTRSNQTLSLGTCRD